jgi:hypothetical protein
VQTTRIASYILSSIIPHHNTPKNTLSSNHSHPPSLNPHQTIHTHPHSTPIKPPKEFNIPLLILFPFLSLRCEYDQSFKFLNRKGTGSTASADNESRFRLDYKFDYPGAGESSYLQCRLEPCLRKGQQPIEGAELSQVGGACGRSLWAELVGGACGRSLWVELVGGACGRSLWVELVGGACGWSLWVELVGGACGWSLVRDG